MVVPDDTSFDDPQGLGDRHPAELAHRQQWRQSHRDDSQ